jgi:cellulose synthase/poly-beta-1,6-N-acetylglucosamine synthase-like glycosyltransferase
MSPDQGSGAEGAQATLDEAAVSAVNATLARALGIAPLRLDADGLLIAARAEDERAVGRTLALMLDKPVRVVVTEREEIERVQLLAYGAAEERDAVSAEVSPSPSHASPSPVAASEADRERYREIADRFNLPFVSLEPHRGADGELVDPVEPETARLLGIEACRALGVVPITATGGSMALATARPAAEDDIKAAAALSGLRVWVLVAAPADIETAIERSLGTDEPSESPPLAPLAAPAAAAALAPALPEREPPPQIGGPEEAHALAQVLLERGAIEPEAVEQALAIQRSYGGAIGEVLTHNGLADERAVARALAEQRRLTFTDPSHLKVDHTVAGLLDERLARRLRVAPLALAGDTLIIASVNPLGEREVAVLSEHFGGPVRTFLAPASTVDGLLTQLHAAKSIDTASLELRRNRPEDSASVVLSKGQKVTFSIVAVLLLIGLVLMPLNTVIGFNIFAIIVYTGVIVYRFRLATYSLGHELQLPVSDSEVEALDERTLPVYTLLVPLYKEPEVIGFLVKSLSKLDYPKTKLDIKVLLEADDEETQAAFRKINPPPHFQMVVCPDSEPKTKPKACNYGLLQARGDFVVIFDAEDQPEADQLKKAIVAFRKAPADVVCLQCSLNYFNQRQTLLTRWFTSEYSMWFDLMLPGLDAEGVPIPLGGTSNHFRIDGLIDSGAWDPYNVTEDADLGVRLHKRGLRTEILDSTTYEEATSQIMNWIRQRSRWVKGYIQTWLVQMRHPFALLREIGLKGWLSFQLTVGGTVLVFLLNPIYWLLTTAWLLTEAGVIESAFPSFLYYAGGLGFYFGNFVLAYMFAAGTARRGYHDLVKYALFVPVYWLLMSIAAWKGLIQLITKPHYWEKTQHGLFEGADEV